MTLPLEGDSSSQPSPTLVSNVSIVVGLKDGTQYRIRMPPEFISGVILTLPQGNIQNYVTIRVPGYWS